MPALARSRVLLLLAALVGALAAPAGAQDLIVPPEPPRPPVLLVNLEEGMVPVHVRSLRADVEIVGFLAETTLVMTFDNPNPRVLEGELIFPLPEGAVISGYGLDVGGELVDGVVVERQAARVAYESEMVQQVDPGLAEWVQGSLFRTRIYPFPAGGSRTIKVSYVSDLTVRDGAAVYDLPMAYHDRLAQLDLRVAVSQGRAEPTIEAGDLANLTFAAWESQFVAETSLTDIDPRDDIHVAVPLEQDAPVVQRDGDVVTFVLSEPLPELAPEARPAPDRVAIVLDASSSRDEAQITRERELVEAWAATVPGATIELYALRDRVEFVASFAPGADRVGELSLAIAEEPRDGGTDLSALVFSGESAQAAGERIDYYLFLSDGLGSLGEPSLETAGAPVIAVTSAAGANHTWLAHLARSSGGAYVNLQRASNEHALETIATMPVYLYAVEVVSGEVDEIEAGSGFAASGRVLVSGRITSDSATLTLRFRRGRDAAHSTTLRVDASRALEGDLTARAWAQSRITRLALNADAHAAELLALGQANGMVTPNTSYLVLETLEQHLEHGIAPAATRPAMLAQYQAEMATRSAAVERTEAQHLERVVSSWQQRVAWWTAHGEMPTAIAPGTTNTGGSVSGSDGDYEFEATEEIPSFDPAPTPSVAVAPNENAPAPEAATRQVTDSLNLNGAGSAGGAPAPGAPARERASGETSASADDEGDFSGRADVESGDTRAGDGNAGVSVQPWNPATPYLTALQAVSPEDAYGVYLDQKFEFGRSPAFYLDVATYLYGIDQPSLARRVLTNIAEMELGEARLLRIVAYKLQVEGDLDLAIRLFEEVLAERPEEPQSRRDLAVALSQRGDQRAESEPAYAMADYARAVALVDELVRSDLGRFETIELPALMEANRVIARMERLAAASDMAVPTLPLDARLRQNLDLDVRVILRWDTDHADMDLWVTEPSGERCYYGNRSTAYGATYGRDYTDGYGPEEYLIRRAPEGGYLVQANFFGTRQQELTGGTTLQVDIFTDWGRPEERRHSTAIRLTDRGETLTIGTVELGAGAAAFASEAR
jgi:Ca-activated chloride channel family protein